MKAEELRFRNLVTADDGKIYYVSNLSLDIDDEYNELIGAVLFGESSHEVLREERELHWKPIHLTEEWLLKLGFEKTEGVLIKPCGIIDLQFSDTMYAYFNIKYQPDNSMLFEPGIKHVHQLQNLYFALTGQELELK